MLSSACWNYECCVCFWQVKNISMERLDFYENHRMITDDRIKWGPWPANPMFMCCLIAAILFLISVHFSEVIWSMDISEGFFLLWFWCRIRCTCIMENSIWEIAILKEAWISSLAIVLLSWSIVISTASQQVMLLPKAGNLVRRQLVMCSWGI